MIELDGSTFIKKSKLYSSDGRKKYSVLPTVLFYTSKYFRKEYKDSYLPETVRLKTSYKQDILSSLLKYLHEDKVSIKKTDFKDFVQIALDLEIDRMYPQLTDICEKENYPELKEKIENEKRIKEKEKEEEEKALLAKKYEEERYYSTEEKEMIEMEYSFDITDEERNKINDETECIDFLSELYNSDKSRFFYLLTQVEYKPIETDELKRLYEYTGVKFLGEIVTLKSMVDEEIEKRVDIEEKNSELVEETEKLKEEIDKLKKRGGGSSGAIMAGEIAKLKDKLGKLQNENHELAEKLQENEENFNDILVQLDEKDNEIDTLKAIVSESDTTELKNEIRILTTKCKKLENELNALKEKKLSASFDDRSFSSDDEPAFVREPAKKPSKSASSTTAELLTTLVQKNRFSDFKELIENQGISPNFVDKENRSSLHIAAINDRRDFIKYLIQIDEIDVNSKDKYGKTPLHYAIENRRDESAKILVVCEKVALDITTDTMQTILHTAAAKNFDTFIKFLSIYLKEHPSRNPSRMVNIDMKDRNGKTAIHIAAQKGMEAALKALLQFNPSFDINLQDNDGRTALHWAASTGRENTVKFLLEIRNINVNIKDINGKTPAFLASENKRTAVLKQIIAHPSFDPNLTDKDGNALIISCAQKGNIEIAKCLLSCPAVNFNIRDSIGRTPLHITAENGKTDFLQWLLETGKADSSLTTPLGRTAYDIACLTRSRSREILEKYR